MDSTTLCAYYLEKEYEVYPIIFSYGSKHNKYENEAALRICEFYGLPQPKFVELPFINQLFKSNLLQSGGEIPEGHYQAENMTQTVVPARNIIFTSIMAGYAWSIGAEIVAFGAHSGDHAIYDDCRPTFASAMNTAVMAGTGERVRIQTPFLYFDKTKILEMGYSIRPNVPYELTRTCYKDQELACGKCGSCQERLEAFANIGIEDPVKYE
jgi:7-cyano-7-deazaguanine synthase